MACGSPPWSPHGRRFTTGAERSRRTKRGTINVLVTCSSPSVEVVSQIRVLPGWSEPKGLQKQALQEAVQHLQFQCTPIARSHGSFEAAVLTQLVRRIGTTRAAPGAAVRG